MFGFTWRNFRYAVGNVRNLAAVRKAMSLYHQQHPSCAWCGRTAKVDVHHVEPVQTAPDKAADPSNMISLCRTPTCHCNVGHMGDFKKINPRVREVCATVNGG